MPLQESIDGALALLPADKSLVDFADFRNQVLATGDQDAGVALAKIVQNRLANMPLARNEATGKLVLRIGSK